MKMDERYWVSPKGEQHRVTVGYVHNDYFVDHLCNGFLDHIFDEYGDIEDDNLFNNESFKKGWIRHGTHSRGLVIQAYFSFDLDAVTKDGLRTVIQILKDYDFDIIYINNEMFRYLNKLALLP